MIVQTVGGMPVRLKEHHDLSFVEAYGQVFSVYDEHSCGMLSFGLLTPQGHRVYLKYAGAPTVNYPSAPAIAVQKLNRALPHYRQLSHPALIRFSGEQQLDQGTLAIFEWADGLPLGPHPEGYASFRALPLIDRLRLFDALCDFHVQAEQSGLAIAGLSDAHLIFQPQTGRLILSNIDEYLPLPSLNTRGRLPGSPLYLPPEGYKKGDGIDETSNVYFLSALSHGFFGDKIEKTRAAWQAPEKLYQVAARGLNEDRGRRQQSSDEFLAQWRAAVSSSRLN